MKHGPRLLPLLAVFCLSLFGLAFNPAWAAEPDPEGMFTLYEENRAKGIPNYITEDFILLAYSQALNEAVTDLEEKVLLPAFTKLVELALQRVKAADPPNEISRANASFLMVILTLLTGQEPTAGGDEFPGLREELVLVRAAASLARSDLVQQQLDYTQFKVRGKYTRTPALSRYFQGVKYAQTVIFPVKESQSTGLTAAEADRLTQQALALAKLLTEDKELNQAYREYVDRLDWIFGPGDDLTLEDYFQAGQKFGLTAGAEVRAALLTKAKEEDRQPAIISAVVDSTRLEKDVTSKDVVTGWRFIPSRFTPDSAAFQLLVYDHFKGAKKKDKKTPFSLVTGGGTKIKGFPLGLEIMALLGSKEAEKRLDKTGERSYEGYQQAAKEAKSMLDKPAGMPSVHLQIINHWLTGGAGGQPPEGRRLNTCLGFWTYQRYLSQLYTKQSYTAVVKGIHLPDAKRETAWIEPAVDLYQAIENNIKTLLSHLPDSQRLSKLQGILGHCREVASKVSQGTNLTPEDISFLNDLDLQFIALTGGPDLPIVVDVHTEPNSQQVLEEALGHPRLVSKTINDITFRGALFNYFEFKYAMASRLTDQEWRIILNSREKITELPKSGGSTPAPKTEPAQ